MVGWSSRQFLLDLFWPGRQNRGPHISESWSAVRKFSLGARNGGAATASTGQTDSIIRTALFGSSQEGSIASFTRAFFVKRSNSRTRHLQRGRLNGRVYLGFVERYYIVGMLQQRGWQVGHSTDDGCGWLNREDRGCEGLKQAARKKTIYY